MNADTDDSTELARWLEDSGRRRAMRPAAPGEKELIESLQRELDATRRELEEARRARERRRIGRELTFVALLAAALAQYYFTDIAVQISRLHSNYYFVTVTR